MSDHISGTAAPEVKAAHPKLMLERPQQMLANLYLFRSTSSGMS
jgi:hypothetical protein